jgi:hypothetical protein
MRDIRTFAALILLGLLAVMPPPSSFALELEPRQWNHLPVGTNFFGVGYAYTQANIYFDPALRLEDVEMGLHTMAAKYIRTFGLFGKSARIDLSQGYQDGQWTGLLDGTQASTSRSGLTDTFVRLAVNLYGAPALSGKAFQRYRAAKNTGTIVGIGLALRLPTGDYMEDKLINIGKNRFALRPQLGISYHRGKWAMEASGEVAFHGENDEFFNGNRLEQKPLYIVHGHLVYTFLPGLWVEASAGYDHGGESRLNGIDNNDTRRDIAWALRFAYPISRTLGVKVSYINSRTLESVGFDSDTVSAGFSFYW